MLCDPPKTQEMLALSGARHIDCKVHLEEQMSKPQKPLKKNHLEGGRVLQHKISQTESVVLAHA